MTFVKAGQRPLSQESPEIDHINTATSNISCMTVFS